jgi:hypothetical protein
MDYTAKGLKGKVICMLKTQQLITSAIDGVVCVNSEETYNQMNNAMCQFNKSLCRKEFKSFYSEQDIQVLDNCRTIANYGTFDNIIQYYDAPEEAHVEVQTRHELSPELDYKGEPIVDTSTYLFFNPDKNETELCDGKGLKEFLNKFPDLDVRNVRAKTVVVQKDYLLQKGTKPTPKELAVEYECVSSPHPWS